MLFLRPSGVHSPSLKPGTLPVWTCFSWVLLMLPSQLVPLHLCVCESVKWEEMMDLPREPICQCNSSVHVKAWWLSCYHLIVLVPSIGDPGLRLNRPVFLCLMLSGMKGNLGWALSRCLAMIPNTPSHSLLHLSKTLYRTHPQFVVFPWICLSGGVMASPFFVTLHCFQLDPKRINFSTPQRWPWPCDFLRKLGC